MTTLGDVLKAYGVHVWHLEPAKPPKCTKCGKIALTVEDVHGPDQRCPGKKKP